ncbi:MAG: hypothetical protein E7604_09250 [Ruminococcaceae bacterium]|nr:hypothetical protein [Oscillospiraceae bacterium]
MKKHCIHPTLHPSRVLTETAMATHTHDFKHTPVGQALFDALKERLGLTVVAGYLVINGTGPYEILDLFVDLAKSDPCWERRLAETSWAHNEQHRQIRDVLFEIFAIYGLTPPIERKYDRETGELISNTCFNISLIDFESWQTYWSENDR